MMPYYTNFSKDILDISRRLIEKNGWEDQFAISNKIFSKTNSELLDFNLGKNNFTGIVKRVADALIVICHPINYLKITEPEIRDVAYNGYMQNGKMEEAKIPRTYRRVLGIKDYKPGPDFDLELDKMAKNVIKHQTSLIGKEKAEKSQLNLSASELLELCTELSRFTRIEYTKETRDFNEKNFENVRENIIQEIFDVLYCIRYIMLITKITKKDIDPIIELRLREINSQQFGIRL